MHYACVCGFSACNCTSSVAIRGSPPGTRGPDRPQHPRGSRYVCPSCTPAEHARASDHSLGTACYPMGLLSNHSGLLESLGLIPHTTSPQFRVHTCRTLGTDGNMWQGENHTVSDVLELYSKYQHTCLFEVWVMHLVSEDWTIDIL